jgi:hypothetical protein
MNRRELLLLGGAMSATGPLGAQRKPIPTVGYLGISSPGPFAPLLAAFHEGLRETGFVDGQNVRLEYRWAEGREERLPGLASDDRDSRRMPSASPIISAARQAEKFYALL